MRMFPARTTRRVRAALALTALGVLATAGYAIVANATTAIAPAFTIKVTPSTLTLYRTQSAVFKITLTTNGAFSDPVTLSASALPTGVTGSFTVNPIDPTSATSSFILSAAGTAPVITTSITFTGTSGALTSTATRPLSVAKLPSSNFTMKSSPGTNTAGAGNAVAYAVSLTRANLADDVTLKIGSTLPPGVSASFSPKIVPGPDGSASTVTLSTSGSTPLGTYVFEIDGTGGTFSTGTKATLVVATPLDSFTISGKAIQTLYPGVTSPINLVFHNPNSVVIFVTNVTVKVTSTTKNSVCRPATFTTTNFSYGTTGRTAGTAGVRVSSGGSSSLLNAGVPQSAWPTITMPDTAGSQRPCAGVTVSLAYTNGKAYRP